jgi:hypothetical protein
MNNKQTSFQWAPSVLLSLTLGFSLFTHAPLFAQGIAGTNEVGYTDFDSGGVWGYGYFYSWGWPGGNQFTNGTYVYNYSYTDPILTNGPVVGAYYFTNVMMADLMTNSGAGYGTGFGGPVLPGSSGFINLSTNLDDYIFSFDARVEGLAPGQTTANAEMQAQWQSGGNILQHNFDVAVSSNWTHYSALLSDATSTGGSPGTVSNWVYAVQNGFVSAMQWNVNMNQPDPQFGFDDNNAAFVDNIRLDMIVRTGAPPVLPPTEAKTIIDWNMDDKPMYGGWGGSNWSQNTFLPTFTWSPAEPGAGVGGSNAWTLHMDNSALAAPNTPQWAGGGTGDNGPTDYSLFDTGDLKSYKLTFDARAEGLNPLKEDTVCRLQFFMDIAGNNMRLDFNIPAGSNWVTTSYLLNSGSVGLGSKAAFATNFAVTAVRIQCQIENAQSEADWGFDADNTLAVDNIKLQRIYIATPPLQIATSGNNVIVTWAQPATGTAKLQSANTVLGPWSDVNNATSPYSSPLANAPRYFRTQWVAP